MADFEAGFFAGTFGREKSGALKDGMVGIVRVGLFVDSAGLGGAFTAAGTGGAGDAGGRTGAAGGGVFCSIARVALKEDNVSTGFVAFPCTRGKLTAMSGSA